jgi:hypothetical protein
MLLRVAGEAEAAIVRSQDEWRLDPDFHARKYQPDDRLIDAAGVEYRLEHSGGAGRDRNAILPTGRRYDPTEVQAIAERHIGSVGAKPEWLSSHLKDIPEGQKIRAIILYLSKLAAAEASDVTEDEE